MKAVSRRERAENLLRSYPQFPLLADDWWRLEFWDEKTAYLQLGTFDVFQLTFEWDDFLNRAFEQISKKKVEKLVIDIRWNEGGQDEVLLLLGKYLAKENISLIKRSDKLHFDKVPSKLRPYLNTWDKRFYDLSKEVEKRDDGFYTWRKSDDKGIQLKANAAAFKGEVYLMVNGANSSATFYFAELAQQNKLATLVGTPTGGSQKGLNGGAMFFVRLPNSSIEFDLPIVGSYSPEKPLDGIHPDILIQEEAADFINWSDPMLEKLKLQLKK